MQRYFEEVEQKMKQFASWLCEKDRRRYTAIEALKLGHGGIDSIAEVLQCDTKNIRQGMRELEEPFDPAPNRVRKNGGGRRPLTIVFDDLLPKWNYLAVPQPAETKK